MSGDVTGIGEIVADYEIKKGYKIYTVLKLILMVAPYPLSAKKPQVEVFMTEPVLYEILLNDVNYAFDCNKDKNSFHYLKKFPGFEDLLFKRELLMKLKIELVKAMKKASKSKNNPNAKVGNETKKVGKTAQFLTKRKK